MFINAFLAGDSTKQWADFSKKTADVSPSIPNRIASPDFRWKISLDTRKQPSYTPIRQKQCLINRGADFPGLEALRESLAARAEALFHRTVGCGFTGTAAPRRDGRVFLPPFPLESLEYHHYESEGGFPAPVPDTRFRGATGELGSMTLVSAFDGRLGAGERHLPHRLLLVFRAPRPGRPVLSMELEAAGVRCGGTFREEAGGTGASTLQLGRLYGQVYAGAGEAIRTYCPHHLISSCNSGGDRDWRFRALSPGSVLKACFMLATPVPEGSWAVITAGVETLTASYPTGAVSSAPWRPDSPRSAWE